ncbi:MAG: hypothetical protein ABIG95_03005 [Candidatus Woesearchaeota archaeon]
MQMFSIIGKSDGKAYKQLARCHHCGLMYEFVKALSNSRYYCRECYITAYPNDAKLQKLQL